MNLELRPWRRVGCRLIISDSHHISNRLVEMSNELASTLTSMQDLMVRMTRLLDQLESSLHEPPSVVVGPYETVPLALQTT